MAVQAVRHPADGVHDMLGWLFMGVLTAFTLLGPIQRRTETNWARHNALFVTLPFTHITEASGQSPAGRRAQELGENRFQGLVGCVVASVLVWWFDATAIAGFTGVLIALSVKAMLYRLPVIDVAGHGAEIIVAEREGRDGYRDAEIARMLRDPKRSGQSAEYVAAQLKRWRWLSLIMIGLAR